MFCWRKQWPNQIQYAGVTKILETGIRDESLGIYRPFGGPGSQGVQTRSFRVRPGLLCHPHFLKFISCRYQMSILRFLNNYWRCFPYSNSLYVKTHTLDCTVVPHGAWSSWQVSLVSSFRVHGIRLRTLESTCLDLTFNSEMYVFKSWANCLTSLCLYFLTCKMVKITTPTSKGCHEEQRHY